MGQIFPSSSGPARAFGLLFSMLLSAPVSALELGLPAQCTIGKDCFVQQYPDMDAGPPVADPFCGPATYDGHDGTDLRVLSMADVARGVAVVAVADGTVLRMRDGDPDHLVTSEADRAAVADKECGNGMIVDLGSGLEVQYCHLRQGSLAVKPGDLVKRGQKLGEIGASGLAQFPHVHLTVRRDGKALDPATGRDLSAGCLKSGETAQPLFAPEIVAELAKGESQTIALGVAGGPVDYAALSVSGPPPQATTASPAIVGWGWFINLHKGDRIVVRLSGPDGQPIAVNRSDPMDRAKASYSAFAGKKGAPKPGVYKVQVAVERDGSVFFERDGTYSVE
jgi:hypothetical protein